MAATSDDFWLASFRRGSGSRCTGALPCLWPVGHARHARHHAGRVHRALISLMLGGGAWQRGWCCTSSLVWPERRLASPAPPEATAGLHRSAPPCGNPSKGARIVAASGGRAHRRVSRWACRSARSPICARTRPAGEVLGLFPRLRYLPRHGHQYRLQDGCVLLPFTEKNSSPTGCGSIAVSWRSPLQSLPWLCWCVSFNVPSRTFCEAMTMAGMRTGSRHRQRSEEVASKRRSSASW